MTKMANQFSYGIIIGIMLWKGWYKEGVPETYKVLQPFLFLSDIGKHC